MTINYYNEAEKSLLELYEKIKLGKNDVCAECHVQCDFSNPIGCWVIGNNFYRNEKRILFIGKNARGNPGNSTGTFNSTFEVAREYLWNQSWPYWSYTREVCKRLFHDDTIENIAFTNIVKCNDSPDVDTTSERTKDSCINRLGVVRKEIELILPTHIIFYTAWDYDRYINGIFDSFEVKLDTTRIAGKKNILWQESETTISDKNIHVLRTGHPERKKKEDFVDNIVGWVLSN